MLHITGSMKALKKEVRSALGVTVDVIGTLEQIVNKGMNWEMLSNLIRGIPEYKILSKDAEAAKQILRKVCSCEISARDAIVTFTEAKQELINLHNLLQNFN